MEKAKATPLFILLAASLAATAVFASVFVYYPVKIQVSPTAPPVIFSAGTNSNGTDLRGNKIEVRITEANTSLSVTVHPTYQVTYYKNITVINNTDSKAYYIKLRVNTPASDSNLQHANLTVMDSNGYVKGWVDLISNLETDWILLDASQHYSLDLNITYTASGDASYSNPPGSVFTTSIQLIYSPTNSEAAPGGG